MLTGSSTSSSRSMELDLQPEEPGWTGTAGGSGETSGGGASQMAGQEGSNAATSGMVTSPNVISNWVAATPDKEGGGDSRPALQETSFRTRVEIAPATPESAWLTISR